MTHDWCLLLFLFFFHSFWLFPLLLLFFDIVLEDGCLEYATELAGVLAVADRIIFIVLRAGLNF